jgi:hypothetical protein
VEKEQTVLMPLHARVLSLQVQNETPTIWAREDDGISKGKEEERVFLTFATGEPMPDVPMSYISTYLLSGGLLVFHVWEARRGGMVGRAEKAVWSFLYQPGGGVPCG